MKALSVDFAFYGVLDLIQRSISLILLPLYTRVLSPEQYGELDILLITVSICVVLVDLQFLAGFSRLYLEYLSRGEGPRFVGTVILTRLIGSVVFTGLVFLVGTAGYLDAGFVPLFTGNLTAWGLVALLVPFSLLHDVLLMQVRMLRRKGPFAAGALSSPLVSAIVTVAGVAWLGWALNGVLFGLVAGKLVGVTILGWFLRREVMLRIDRAILKPLLAYSLPLVPGWWLAFSSAYIGRFVVYGTHGAADNALLAVCMKVTTVLGLFAVSFRSAWMPMAMSYIGNPGSEAFYVRSMRLFMAGSLFMAVCLGAALDPLLAVSVPESYRIVSQYFPLFAVATVIGNCENNFQLGNQIAKRTHLISLGALVFLVVNVLVLWVFAERWGVIAAGLGLLAAASARALVTYISAQRSLRINYDIRSIAYFIAGCVLFLALGAAMAWRVAPDWTVHLAMLALALGWPLLILDRTERAYAGRVVSTAGRRLLRGVG